MWIIAIDGGGTKCDAGLFNPSGELVARAHSGPANVFANFDGAIEAIESACEQLIDKVNKLEPYKADDKLSKKDCFLSLACAGGGVRSAKEKFQQWQHQYLGAALITDVHASCLGANNGESCALFVIGTGSCLAVWHHQEIRHYGGHGFLLGDEASGAWLGKKAVSWYLRALESPAEDTDLQRVLEAMLGDDASEIIDNYGHASADTFGALVPRMLQDAHSSHTVNTWLTEGAEYAHDLLTQHSTEDLPTFLSGGLAASYQPLIAKISKRPILLSTHSALDGAYYAAKQYLSRSKR